jgi:hypothetical protein
MTMEDENSILPPPKRTPWNKGKLIGAKPPLLARHVWSIRTKLQIERRARELAMFNLAIDSKLRGCDVVAMKVEDVAPSGYPLARATVRQRKTHGPWLAFKRAVDSKDWPSAGAGLSRIRQIIAVNLPLGLLVVVIGASGRYWG